jgi:hypothetical protein
MIAQRVFLPHSLGLIVLISVDLRNQKLTLVSHSIWRVTILIFQVKVLYVLERVGVESKPFLALTCLELLRLGSFNIFS